MIQTLVVLLVVVLIVVIIASFLPIDAKAKQVVYVVTAVGALVFLLMTFLGGCGGSTPTVELETARAAACDAAEETLAAECGPSRGRACTPEDYAKVDCLRLACDELHERIVGGEQ